MLQIKQILQESVNDPLLMAFSKTSAPKSYSASSDDSSINEFDKFFTLNDDVTIKDGKFILKNKTEMLIDMTFKEKVKDKILLVNKIEDYNNLLAALNKEKSVKCDNIFLNVDISKESKQINEDINIFFHISNTADQDINYIKPKEICNIIKNAQNILKNNNKFIVKCELKLIGYEFGNKMENIIRDYNNKEYDNKKSSLYISFFQKCCNLHIDNNNISNFLDNYLMIAKMRLLQQFFYESNDKIDFIVDSISVSEDGICFVINNDDSSVMHDFSFDKQWLIGAVKELAKEKQFLIFKDASSYDVFVELIENDDLHAKVFCELYALSNDDIKNKKSRNIYASKDQIAKYTFIELLPKIIESVENGTGKLRVSLGANGFCYGEENGDKFIADYFFLTRNKDGLELYLGGDQHPSITPMQSQDKNDIIRALNYILKNNKESESPDDVEIVSEVGIHGLGLILNHWKKILFIFIIFALSVFIYVKLDWIISFFYKYEDI